MAPKVEAVGWGLYKGAVGEGCAISIVLSLSQLLLSKLFSLALGLLLFAFSLRSLWFLASALEVASPVSTPPH